MPINLTTPTQTGDLQAKIVETIIRNEESEIVLRIQFGATLAGLWVRGLLAEELKTIRNIEAYIDQDGEEVDADPQYDILMATATATTTDEIVPGAGGYKTYAAVKRGLYEWLQADDPRFEGPIV